MTHEQQQWLRTTRARVRCVAFRVEALLHDQSTLVGVCFEEREHIQQQMLAELT